MAIKTVYNPFGIDDMGLPDSVPLHIHIWYEHSETFARELIRQVWYIIHGVSLNTPPSQSDLVRAGNSAVRLTYEKPKGKFAPFGNHCVARLVPFSYNITPGADELTSVGMMLSLPNVAAIERSFSVRVRTDAPDNGLALAARTVSHALFHTAGRKDVAGPEGMLMVSRGAVTWVTVVPEDMDALQYAWRYTKAYLVAV